MSKKGFAAVIPVLIIALLVASGFVGLSLKSDNSQKQAVGKVLSEKSQEQGESGKSGSETQQVSSQSLQLGSTNNPSPSSQPTSSQDKQKVEIENEQGKLKIKTKNEQTGFESGTEVEAGKEKTKIKLSNVKVEIDQEGDKLVTNFKDENGKEIDLEATEEAEVLDSLDKKLKDDDIKIASGSAELGFTQKGRRVRTNFPLSVNPTTGQLFVTTASGTKIVAILPQQAIENMIEAGVLTRTEEPQSPPPPDSSGSAQITTANNASIELTELNNQPAYAINGIKTKNVFGFIPVDLKIKTFVSASDGNLLAMQESLLTRILSFISF